MSTSPDDAFRNAVDYCNEINDALAETDGAICEMSFDGAIGYHVFVADGETEPEFLWKVAFLQAVDSTVLEMAYVDASEPGEARRQLERDLGEYFDHWTTETVADEFERNLRSLIENNREFGGDGE